jgi:VIT family
MAADIDRYRNNLRDEMNGAALYTALAAAEPDPLRRDLFQQLAEAEMSHAQLWRDRLVAAGLPDQPFVPDFRTRLLTRLMRLFGPSFVLPTIAAAEFADRNKYAGQSDAHAISAEERGHAAVIQAVAGNSGSAGASVGGEIARAEPWQDAQRVAAQVMLDKQGALDTLAREELGIDPTELGGNPWSAAATSFALFSAGAIFPVAPFVWMTGHWAIGASVIASGAALGAVGMLTSLFNGRSAWYSAARQLVFGCLAAGVTYGVGAVLGALQLAQVPKS